MKLDLAKKNVKLWLWNININGRTCCYLTVLGLENFEYENWLFLFESMFLIVCCKGLSLMVHRFSS